MNERFHWISPARLVASRYPASPEELAALRDAGVRTIINLTDRPHDPEVLRGLGIDEISLPVPDFTAPDMETLRAAVGAIDAAHEAGHAAAVHCLGGLGRTGTVGAAWLTSQGFEADAAIRRVRSIRPGSIETRDQEEAVRAFAASLKGQDAG